MQQDGEASQQTNRKTGYWSECLMISLSAVTSTTGAVTLHLLSREVHLKENLCMM